MSICTGAFALAAVGLLDGRRAATHWQDTDELTRRHPDVEVDPNVLYIDQGRVLTSAGVAAGLDLCLHLVRTDLGAAEATRVARRMVVAPRRSGGQAQFVAPATPRGPWPAAGSPRPASRRCVPLYGRYDWVTREGLGRGQFMTFLERVVVRRRFDDAPEMFRAASRCCGAPAGAAVLRAARRDRLAAVPWSDVHRAWALAQASLRYADAIYVAAAERHRTAC